MFTKQGLQSICLSIDGCNITSDSCKITEVCLTHHCSYDDMIAMKPFSEPQIKPSQHNVEFEIRGIISASDFSETFEGIKSNKISEKKVKDCSARELLFAAKHKLEE